MAAWAEHAIFWQVYPLGFTGAFPGATAGTSPDAASEPLPSASTTTAAHRLSHLEAWLDYAVELGCSGLLLGPIFTSSTHGYDTLDHFTIDPRLGDRDDFDHLVAAAKSRGLRIVLDGVFNHVGREHPSYVAALTGGPDGPDAPLFRLTWPADGGAPVSDVFEGHDALVALNHANPAVVDLVVEVMTFWLDAGADGWRLDAAYAVPLEFWAEVIGRVRATHPDAYIVGEVIHGDYPGFVTATGMDAVTEYELWKAAWSSIVDANWYELEWTMQRHSAMIPTFAPLTFVGNHDVTRIATRINDDRLLPHALVVLLTLGGTPCIYAGDEQGFRGLKEDRAGGDDAIRPTFPATPDGLAPEGWWVYRLHQDLIGLRRRHPWLHTATTTTATITNTGMVYTAEQGDHRLVVALNLAEQPWSAPDAGATSVLAGAATLAGGTLTLAPFGWAVLE